MIVPEPVEWDIILADDQKLAFDSAQAIAAGGVYERLEFFYSTQRDRWGIVAVQWVGAVSACAGATGGIHRI